MKFLKPTTPGEAYKYKKENKNSYYLAGGTQINSLYFKDENCDCLISLEKLQLDNISKNAIGSMATLENIRTAGNAHPALREAAACLNSRNIRNMATIGGNIGSNQSSSDILPVLIALDCKLEIYKDSGKTQISARNWIKNSGGLILSIKIPEPEKKVYQRKFSRTKNDLPIVKLALGTLFEDKEFSSTSIGGGCLDKTVISLDKTSGLLEDKKPEDLNIKELFKTANEEINPVSDQRASASYRKNLVKAFLKEMKEYFGKL
ncbi:MAG: FAD binding domain-containing protein [Elusimicrobiota bacterium]